MTVQEFSSLLDEYEKGGIPEGLVLDATEELGIERVEWRDSIVYDKAPYDPAGPYIHLVPVSASNENDDYYMSGQHKKAVAGVYDDTWWGIPKDHFSREQRTEDHQLAKIKALTWYLRKHLSSIT